MTYRTSVGLDVHARSIAAAALDHLTGEVELRSFGYDPAGVAAWVLSLEGPAGASTSPGRPASTCRGRSPRRASSASSER